MVDKTENIIPNDNYKIIFDNILDDIIRVTHCHGCGKNKNVCFLGYIGQYCHKNCWKRYHDPYISDDDGPQYITCDPDNCKWCNSVKISFAHSQHIINYYSSKSSSGYIWSMLDTNIPCHNDCIMNTKTIKIIGYNA